MAISYVFWIHISVSSGNHYSNVQKVAYTIKKKNFWNYLKNIYNS